MTASELFNRFCALSGLDPSTPWTAWAFGGAPDKQAALVLDGVKTATASARELYGLDGEEMPRAGDMSVVLNSRDEAMCLIRTETVTILPFCEVPASQAFAEGEGDRSLDYWRTVHRAFFTEELAKAGLTFSEDMLVICETFRVLYAPGVYDYVLETPRLRLRYHTWDDFENMKAVLCDRENMAFYPQAFDDREVRRWLNWHLDCRDAWGLGLFAIERKDTGAYIGDCGVTVQRIHGKLVPEIGYHLRLDCHGFGYAAEAARAVRNYAFAHTTFNTLYSYMDAGNTKSQAVARRNGMRQVDAYTEADSHESLVVYAVTRAEWEASQN